MEMWIPNTEVDISADPAAVEAVKRRKEQSGEFIECIFR